MIDYLGKNLYDKVRKLVSSAYYRVYLYNDENYLNIDEVTLDYTTCEGPEDLPLVEVEISYHNKVDGPQYLTLEINLLESDDYNIGHIASAIERCESD